MSGLGIANSYGAGFQHPAFGQDPFIYNTGNITWLAPTLSDFNVLEATNDPNLAGIAGNVDPDIHLQAYLKSGLFVDRMVAQANATRGSVVPSIVDIYTTGPYYFKGNSGTNQFTLGVDYDQCGGFSRVCSTAPPAMIIDQAFFAVAHGYAGVRAYFYDGATMAHDRMTTANQCSTLPNTSGCVMLQEGASSLANLNGAAPVGYGGLGQDRLAAMAAFNAMINGPQSSLGGGSLLPYVMQPAMAPPDQTGSGTCLTYSNTNTSNTILDNPKGIVCGAKSGNGGHLVVIINYQNATTTYTYNPSTYVFPGGSALAWKLTASINQGCGTEAYPAALGVTITDCGIGATSIIGATTVSPWIPGAILPAAGIAPTTTTTLNMQPSEVDVFLYHP